MASLGTKDAEKMAEAIENKVTQIAKQVFNSVPNDKEFEGKIISLDRGNKYTVKINNHLYSNIPQERTLGAIEVGTIVKVKAPNNQLSNAYICGVVDDTSYSPSYAKLEGGNTFSGNQNMVNIYASNVFQNNKQVAVIDASNITVASYQNKLNNMEQATTGTTQTGKQAVVVDSYLSSDGLTWYRIWSDGFKECGGKVVLTVTNAWQQPTITFPLPNGFTQNLLSLSINIKLGDIADTSMYGQINSYSNTSFSTAIYCETNRHEFFWYACGY